MRIPSNKSPMMLAKNLSALKKPLKFPVLVSEKLDGMAAVFTTESSGRVSVLSRQNKPILSVEHIIEELESLHLPSGSMVFGELHIPNTPFKDACGRIRRKSLCLEIKLGVFDYFISKFPKEEYESRIATFEFYQDPLIEQKQYVHLISYFWARSDKDLKKWEDFILKSAEEAGNPNPEGIMIRPSSHIFQPSKRSWDMLRKKKQATIDLAISHFEEAVDKDGNLKGMVGRINVFYKGKVIGIGAGKLPHNERQVLWERQEEGVDYTGIIIEIAYKPDPSYKALREARFIQFRLDKEVADDE